MNLFFSIPEQRKYYFPETVKIDTCRECSGYKYVTCKNPECHGSHYINCQECSGIGKVVCDDCGGAGDVSCERCNGAGEVKCGSGAGQTAWRLLSSKNVLSGCNGSGYLGNKGQEYRCTICGGRGFVSCKECGSRGLVPCKTCRRSGEVSCSNCGASGKVECPDCYGDSQRFGKIDCPLCETAGLMGSFTYVETEIINKNYSAFIDLEKLPIKENDISMHLTDEIYEKYYLFNNSIQININDEIISEYITDFEVKEEIYRDKYPLIIEEDVFYQIIPCIKLNYRFVHTNKIHELVIIDIWNNPKVIFPENPEKLEISLNSAKKSFKGIFGKIFNTNDNKNKIDRINHCKFLIISELKNKGFVSNRIKEYLIEYISVIVDLNNSDIKELIKLCKEEKVENIEKLKFNDDEFRKRAIEILKN